MIDSILLVDDEDLLNSSESGNDEEELRFRVAFRMITKDDPNDKIKNGAKAVMAVKLRMLPKIYNINIVPEAPNITAIIKA